MKRIRTYFLIIPIFLISFHLKAQTTCDSPVETNLSDLDWESATIGYNTIKKNTNLFNSGAIKINNQTFSHGIATHSISEITYNVNSTYKIFKSYVGIDETCPSHQPGSVEFEVLGDNISLFRSTTMVASDAAQLIEVDITNVTQLKLVVHAVDSNGWDHADWAGAVLITCSNTAPDNTNNSSGNWSLNNQDVYYNNGNVGIGTDTPSVKLDVHGGRVHFSKNDNLYARIWPHEYDGGIYGGAIQLFDYNSQLAPVGMFINKDSQEVKVDKRYADGSRSDGVKLISYLGEGYDESITGLQINTTNSAIVIGSWIGYERNKGYGLINRYKTKLEKDLYLSNDSKIGIGVDSENIPSEYHLAVAGKIISEEVKVSLVENWPDYVFNENYNLPTLKELETYINANGHLPNVSPAEQVEKNGIELGEMNAKLLEKIEELTLYIIQQNKRQIELEERIKKLENQK
ncbi:hypothetical protein MHTCC0001_01000 [Flavobacteriaceae bacterium MHTCC 0001]